MHTCMNACLVVCLAFVDFVCVIWIFVIYIYLYIYVDLIKGAWAVGGFDCLFFFSFFSCRYVTMSSWGKGKKGKEHRNKTKPKTKIKKWRDAFFVFSFFCFFYYPSWTIWAPGYTTPIKYASGFSSFFFIFIIITNIIVTLTLKSFSLVSFSFLSIFSLLPVAHHPPRLPEGYIPRYRWVSECQWADCLRQ